jgi:hypothetical protein
MLASCPSIAQPIHPSVPASKKVDTTKNTVVKGNVLTSLVRRKCNEE